MLLLHWDGRVGDLGHLDIQDTSFEVGFLGKDELDWLAWGTRAIMVSENQEIASDFVCPAYL